MDRQICPFSRKECIKEKCLLFVNDDCNINNIASYLFDLKQKHNSEK